MIENVGGRDVVAVLRRWEESGATWRVLDARSESVTVALCSCDGGEEVERLISSDPDLLAYLDGRLRSDE